MKLQPRVKILPSGLTLVTTPMPTESVSAVLLVKAGSRDENQTTNGLSHFVEHMVFKGTQKWPTTQAVNKVIDATGGLFNAFTSQEHTGFWVKAAKKHLNLALEFLYQLVFQPLLPGAELEQERGVILEEIKMRHDEPMTLAADRFISKVYGLTQLGREIIGPAENIKRLQREDFLQYMQSWYQPANMVLSVAGVKKFKVDWPIKIKGKANERQSLNFSQTKPQTQVIEKKIEQAHFCLGVRTFPRTHPDRYVLAVINTILGGNTSSRLWNEIREKRGLAYYVRTNTDVYQETGYLVAQAGCAVDKLAETIKLTVNELEKISAKTVSNKELHLAKEYMTGRLALSQEDSQDVAEDFGESQLLEGRVRTLDEAVRGIEAVTAADIHRVASRIIKHNQFNLTIVGKVQQKVYI